MTLEELSIIYTADVLPAVSAMQDLVSAFYRVSDEITYLQQNFSAAGKQAGQGLADGILSTREKVIAAARIVAQCAANELRSALSIHSPSRLTEEMGMQVGAGLANGILQSAGQVTSAVSSLPPVSMQASPLFDQVTPAQENISITIPLEVDGYQLGVAAIDGINRVSRVTGRAELSV